MPFDAGGPVIDYQAEVGPGWHGLLDGLHRDLAVLNPDYQTVQVKEKFGCLRVYLRSTTEAMDGVLARYEGLSAGVCEECGKPGTCSAKPGRRWIKTLCDPCRYGEPAAE
jgi:hypothetical protein